MRKTQLSIGEFYHVYNRGVDKRVVFQEPTDFERFLKSIEEFNDINHICSWSTISHPPETAPPPREPFVRIIAFVLMPNHYHLFLEQLVENGITYFMHRVGTGYTKYFNIKNDRTGRLFENTFKAIHVDSESYFGHLSRYIHLNPLDLIASGWSQKPTSISNDRIRSFLGSYPWSSYHQYLNRTRPAVVTVEPERILSLFESASDYESFVFNWTMNKRYQFKDVLKSVDE